MPPYGTIPSNEEPDVRSQVAEQTGIIMQTPSQFVIRDC